MQISGIKILEIVTFSVVSPSPGSLTIILKFKLILMKRRFLLHMKKLKVGIIGTGTLAEFHLKAYKSNPYVEITALCDVNIARAREKAEIHKINYAYDDYNEMLKSQNIDAVSIITWNNTHAPITIAALDAGKHVLCEKPPAINAQEAIKMKQAAERNNKLLMYGFVKRFTDSTLVLKNFIDNKELGDIYYVKTGYLRRCGNPGGWFANKEISGGGPLIDLGVHIIDLGMYLMGKPKPVSVFGNILHKVGNRSNIKGITCYKSADSITGQNTVEDFANALIKFDNGTNLYVETSWTMHIKSDTTYMDIFGSMGGAKLEPQLEIYSEKNDYMIDIQPVLSSNSFGFDKAFSAEIDHFVDCIVNDTPCICPAEDGLTIMKVLDAIYESAKTGKLITL
jgi:predicted dehydrogenase